MSTATNKSAASIKVTSGPSRGRTFPINDELVHIGSSAANQIVLDGAGIEGQHLSIMCRGGRYAVFTSLTQAVGVDGNWIPAEQWVWLPAKADIRVAAETELQFDSGADESVAATLEDPASDPSTPSVEEGSSVTTRKQSRGKSGQRTGRSTKEGKKKKQQTARFITDQPAQPLVELGGDGQLPKLSLEAVEETEQKTQEPREWNPLVLVGICGLSMCFSALLLLGDFEGASGDTRSKAEARREIREFWGEEKESLKPYQQELRLAAQSRSQIEAKRHYRHVLELLNAEGHSPASGATGRGKKADERLEELISIILADD